MDQYGRSRDSVGTELAHASRLAHRLSRLARRSRPHGTVIPVAWTLFRFVGSARWFGLTFLGVRVGMRQEFLAISSARIRVGVVRRSSLSPPAVYSLNRKHCQRRVLAGRTILEVEMNGQEECDSQDDREHDGTNTYVQHHVVG